MGKNDRFVVIEKEGTMFARKVIVDKETGVNYLWVSEGYAGGLTPLLDRDGKPVVSTYTEFDK
ncbi:MAG: xylan 1,4-beta-xylosidase [Ruminococcus sp.]|jgi:hypothetical protein|nr:xylan 1,4-beta-xylosidase [Ruminococcus sp.]